MKKRIIAIAAGAIVLVGMALGVVGFKGEAKFSVTSESTYTTDAGATTLTSSANH